MWYFNLGMGLLPYRLEGRNEVLPAAFAVYSAVEQVVGRVIRVVLPWASRGRQAASLVAIGLKQVEELSSEIHEFKKAESRGGQDITLEEALELIDSVQQRLGLIKSGLSSFRKV